MDAIPTEYHGTVFRSKSEAVFARALELVADRDIMWLYEPEGEGRSWDFRIRIEQKVRCERCGCKTLEKATWALIEYKPSEPTRTYWMNLVEQVRPFAREDSTTDSYIVYGNPWSQERYYGNCYVCLPVFSHFHHEYGWGNFIPEADNGETFLYSHCHPVEKVLGLTDAICQVARHCRFDLKKCCPHDLDDL